MRPGLPGSPPTCLTPSPRPRISSSAAPARTTSRASTCRCRSNQLVIVTGVSGSGKSSLAFDTIYAEGQRRYVESLSAYARQFLERMEKPDVDVDRGHLPGHRDPPEEQHPQPAIDGRHHDRDPRLHAPAVGARRPHRLPAVRPGGRCARRPRSWPGAWLALPQGTRLLIGFDMPVVAVPERDSDRGPRGGRRGRRPTSPRACRSATAANGVGATRTGRRGRRDHRQPGQAGVPAALLVDGRAVDVDDARPRGARGAHAAAGDRRPAGRRGRPARAAHRLDRDGLPRRAVARRSPWRCRASRRGADAVHVFSERFECRRCGITYEDPQPRLFSFNNPFGACADVPRVRQHHRARHGPRRARPGEVDRQGAIEPWSKPHYRAHLAELKRVAKPLGVPLDTPWQELTAGAEAARRRGRRRRLRGHPRLLRLARAQEIQGARPRVPEPLSRAT